MDLTVSFAYQAIAVKIGHPLTVAEVEATAASNPFQSSVSSTGAELTKFVSGCIAQDPQMGLAFATVAAQAGCV